VLAAAKLPWVAKGPWASALPSLAVVLGLVAALVEVLVLVAFPMAVVRNLRPLTEVVAGKRVASYQNHLHALFPSAVRTRGLSPSSPP